MCLFWQEIIATVPPPHKIGGVGLNRNSGRVERSPLRVKQGGGSG